MKYLFTMIMIFFHLFKNESYAQDFQITPSLIITANGLSSDEQVMGEGKFTNTSTQKKTYQWYRIKNQVPKTWKISTCVPGKCYAADKDSGFFVLAAGKSGILDQNFFPQNTSGNAIIEFYVYEKNQKNKAVKVIYKAEIVEVKTSK